MQKLLLFVLIICSIVAAEYCSPNLTSSEFRCRNGGFCNSSLTCECLPMFKGDFCELPRRSQFTAFMLSFMFTSFGAMNWYLGLFAIALPQTILGVVTLCCCAGLSSGKNVKDWDEKGYSDKTKAILSCFIILGFVFNIMMAIWWFCDWSRVLTHNIVDGKGDELYWDIHPFPTGE